MSGTVSVIRKLVGGVDLMGVLLVARGESSVTEGSMNKESSSVLVFELIVNALMSLDASVLTTAISFSELRDVFFLSFVSSLELFGFR